MTLRALEFNETLDASSDSDIHYLQSQNGNLYSSDYFTDGNSPSEYDHLREDVPNEVLWCTEALGWFVP
jgi:jumonji domain-containing protein 7